MNRQQRRARKLTGKQKAQMRRRVAHKITGMSWKGWLTDEGTLEGYWGFAAHHKPADRQALMEYVEVAPMRWHILAVVRGTRIDPHGGIEPYDDSAEVQTGQAIKMGELHDLCRETIARAEASTNHNHIAIRFYVITPIP